jgi:hypothetical protein
MGDADGPVIARDVYSELLKNDVLSLADVPYALDLAVRKLRDAGAPPERWATFIHLGA